VESLSQMALQQGSQRTRTAASGARKMQRSVDRALRIKSTVFRRKAQQYRGGYSQ
jgi:hypothetical protein